VAVDLNMNILINIAAYINVLKKIIESETDETAKTKLQGLIDSLEKQKDSFGTNFDQIQKDLNIENPKTVEEILSNSSSFLEGILGAQAAATVGTMAAVAALTLGGSKASRRKGRKGKNKKTKRSKK
jgi:hypothetical protein